MAQQKRRGPLEIVITSINEGGDGLGQKSGQFISVARTSPGDKVRISPPRNPEKWTSADLLAVVSPGPDRIKSPCPSFDQGCGGCQWQHMGYTIQVAWKERIITSILRTKGGYKGPISPMVTMDKPELYRNKLSLKNHGSKAVFMQDFSATTMAPGHCMVQTKALQEAWAWFQGITIDQGIDQIHLRSNSQDQVGIHCFVATENPATLAAMGSIASKCPGCIGLGYTGRQGYRHLAGQEFLSQTLHGVVWNIPHNGFFQTNLHQAGTLLDLVKELGRLTKDDRVLDLYCGSGFFALSLAKGVKEVLGIEENPQAIEAAKASATASGIKNCTFLTGDTGAVLAGLSPGTREIVIVDPPRQGILPRGMEAIIKRKPRRILYISCHGPSLARDYKILEAAGYRGTACTPVDMFPHTSHVETVMALEYTG